MFLSPAVDFHSHLPTLTNRNRCSYLHGKADNWNLPNSCCYHPRDPIRRDCI